MRSRPLALLALLAGASAPFAACKAVDPEVGELRATCDGVSEYGPPAGKDANGVDLRCAPDSDTAKNACDRCENARCCAPRFDCYDDLGCLCADQELDECLEDGDEPEDECWDAFVATGPRAKARAECRNGACAAECEGAE